MAFEMLKNTRDGTSSMPMQTTVILMVPMILCGICVLAYGIWNLYGAWKRDNKTTEENRIEDEQERKETK